MKRNVHVFDNGVMVFGDHLGQKQRIRYKRHNVHEAEEEDVFTEILKDISQDGCFVNIGSAIGYYPLLAKRLIPGLTVHAIEPLEKHRAFFIENIALNGLKQSSFIIHSEGISSLDGKEKLLIKGYGSSILRGCENKQSKNIVPTVKSLCKALLAHAGFKRFNTTQIIKTRTLDNLCREVGRLVDLCQMDVQGLELDVLAGARNALQTGNIRTFLIGTHSQKLHDSCINHLIDNGYVIEYEIYTTKEQPDGILVASKGCRKLSESTTIR